MRIHHDTLTADDITAAAEHAGVTIVRSTAHRSATRRGAFDVVIAGSGRQGGQYGALKHKSASWDEYGMFLEYLFARDARVTVPRVYADHDAFTFTTGGRFAALTPDGAHHYHKWTHEPYDRTATITTVHCTCGAVQQFRRG